MPPPDISSLNFDGLIAREWLAVNGLGGYASSTLCGMNTRKYHGLLVAAMTPPVRRMVLLSHVDETVTTESGPSPLACNEYPGTIYPQGYRLLRAFSAEPYPRWAYQGPGFTLEKSVSLLRGENTVCLTYTLLGGGKPVSLEARPLLALRGIHELTYQWNGRLLAEVRREGQVRIPATTRTPEVFFAHDGEFRGEPYWYLNAIYRGEENRGYAGLEDLWNPGLFRWNLAPGQSVHLICSADPVKVDRVLEDLNRAVEELDRGAATTPSQGAEGRDETLEALLRAASAFVVTLPPDAPLPVHVIGQYPWSPPQARAALIGMTGLLLIPGRLGEARRLLHSLASQLRDGLIPSEFPEDGSAPRYLAADVSLWFIAAVGDYLRYSDDLPTLRALWPAIESIIQSYRQGTKLGIASDDDELIVTRSPGVPASWMDAQVGEWVVTPRQGRTVELNALWFNALKFAATFAERLEKKSAGLELNQLAEKVKLSFNQKFWNENLKCCFDVVSESGYEASIRPNQIFAISLQYPVLESSRQEAVLRTVVNELLTPLGVRTLSRGDAAYQGRYADSVVSRDRAQHQGTAYPWLLGPLATAEARLHGRESQTITRIRQWLQPCLDLLQGDGLGQIGELFDGDSPHRPGGAIASALSVAEILRSYAQEVLGIGPHSTSKPKIAPIPGESPLTSGRPK
jgi:predicted glycogen debranching enzyme